MKSLEELFETVESKLITEKKIPETVVNTWIKTMEPVDLNNETNTLTLKTITRFNANIFESNFQSKVEEVLESIMGYHISIVVTVEDEEKKQEPKNIHYDDLVEKEKELQTSYENSEYPYTFDTFIVGRSNEFAYAACKSAAQNREDKMNPLFIYGASGLGKTHLLKAILNEYKKNNPDGNIIYVTSEEFGNEFISAVQKKNTTDFHDTYRNADFLLIDDIQFFSGKDSTQEEFFHTFNKLVDENKQIVITSDRPPKDVQTLTDRLRSRFESGVIADISTPDYETRMAIIKRKAELLNLNLPDDVADFIANRLKTNIRQLEGAVKKLKALEHYAGNAPTITVAQAVIRDILTDAQPTPVTVEKIIQETAKIYGVSAEDIRSSKRAAEISTARKVAIYVVREVTGLPLSSIGTEFGNRDHSTVVYAVNNITNSIKKDPNLKQLIDDIIKNVKTQTI